MLTTELLPFLPPPCLAGIVACAVIPSTQATGQTGLCESEATLIYLLSSRLARAYMMRDCLKRGSEEVLFNYQPDLELCSLDWS